MKNKFFKKFVALTLAVGTVMPYTVSGAPMVNYKLVYDGKTHNYSAEEVYISVNGEDIENGDMPPVILENRTLVPARAVFEAMGAEVLWNGETSEVFISKGSHVVTIKVGNNTGYKNGSKFTMDVPPKIINDRTVIPVRAVSEALDCDVEWNGKTRYVIINDKKEEEEKPVEPETPSTNEEEKPVVETPQTPSDNNTSTIPSENANPSGGSVNVSSITIPNSGEAETYVINASGQISNYTTEIVGDDRLVVDIYDATMKISNTNIAVNGSSNVASIRSAQNKMEPQKVTRVVFDLKNIGNAYTVGYTADKKGIAVSFSKNEINGISMASDGKADTVTISGKYAPVGSITRLTNPDRVVIDFANSSLSIPATPNTAGLNVITSARTGQYNDSTARVTLEVPSNVEVTTASVDNTFKVSVFKGTLDNISYNSSTRTITMKKVANMNINSIAHNDDYLNLKYVMTLPGDFSSQYGYGTYEVNDSYLNNFVIGKDSSGKTTITFSEKQITAYTVTEDAENYYIKVQNPKEKYNFVVVLDAGHGNQDPGTSGNGFKEKDLNLQVLLKTYALFENDGKDDVKVYVTRDDDSYPQNATRAKKANESADMFISIHMNSASPNPVPNGTEVLYKNHSNDIEGRLTSKLLAQTLQNGLLDALGTTDRGIKHRTDLLVLNSTTVPAVIIETGFLSNLGDAQKVSNSEYQQKIAQSIYNSVYYLASNYKVR